MNSVQTRATYIRAKIDAGTKARAADVLAGTGLSCTDAIQMIRIPNATTCRAIAELEAGGGYSANTVQEFMAALNADD